MNVNIRYLLHYHGRMCLFYDMEVNHPVTQGYTEIYFCDFTVMCENTDSAECVCVSVHVGCVSGC